MTADQTTRIAHIRAGIAATAYVDTVAADAWRDDMTWLIDLLTVQQTCREATVRKITAWLRACENHAEYLHHCVRSGPDGPTVAVPRGYLQRVVRTLRKGSRSWKDQP